MRRAVIRTCRRIAGALLGSFVLSACTQLEPRSVARLDGNASAINLLLDDLIAGFPDSLVRLGALEWKARVGTCDAIHAEAEDPARLLASVSCKPASKQPFEFRVPFERGTLTGQLLNPSASKLDARVTIEPAPESWWRALAPGKPPMPERTRQAQRLLHVVWRPEEGLDFSRYAPRGNSQVADLFRLRNQLFSSLVLEGSFELAVYAPHPGARMPSTALALGVKSRSAAAAALDAFINDLLTSWPVHPTPFSLGDAQGRCIPDLSLLPELAPCYVLLDDRVVIGWNRESLLEALGTTPEPSPSQRNRVHVDLTLLSKADRVLAQTLGASPLQISYPWTELTIEGAESNSIRVSLTRSGPQLTE
ncbi:MAG: hypothetical protein HYV07_15695 [Deltaproteobacteria bacterium]|nr:hypothetical protein [Deltaproteobacteria bacterium]